MTEEDTIWHIFQIIVNIKRNLLCSEINIWNIEEIS